MSYDKLDATYMIVVQQRTYIYRDQRKKKKLWYNANYLRKAKVFVLTEICCEMHLNVFFIVLYLWKYLCDFFQTL